jgi:hypothetical protein
MHAIREFVLPSSSEESGSEMPRAERERSFLKGIVTFANGAMSAAVTVVQTSATGARIMVDDGVTLPDRFQLQIPRKGYDGPTRPVWRRNGFAGLAFGADTTPAPSPSPADSAAELRQRIGELERQNAKLRTQLALANASITRLSEGM